MSLRDDDGRWLRCVASALCLFFFPVFIINSVRSAWRVSFHSTLRSALRTAGRRRRHCSAPVWYLTGPLRDKGAYVPRTPYGLTLLCPRTSHFWATPVRSSTYGTVQYTAEASPSIAAVDWPPRAQNQPDLIFPLSRSAPPGAAPLEVSPSLARVHQQQAVVQWSAFITLNTFSTFGRAGAKVRFGPTPGLGQVDLCVQ